MAEAQLRKSLWPGRPVPETIENDWNRFYWDFPDIYDKFAVSTGPVVRSLRGIVGLDGMIVADVGSGTGRSTFEAAQFARVVIGIEPWEPMRQFAVMKQRESAAQNVAFVEGLAQALPLRDQSVDLVMSSTGVPLTLASEFGGVIGDQFVRDARRAVRPGGYVVHCSIAPDAPPAEWTGIPPNFTNRECVEEAKLLIDGYGFDFRDVWIEQRYDSSQHAIESYGFIYGQRCIEYLKRTGRTSFQMKVRIYFQPRETTSAL
jgi:SAM-dependent methyltransferase